MIFKKLNRFWLSPKHTLKRPVLSDRNPGAKCIDSWASKLDSTVLLFPSHKIVSLYGSQNFDQNFDKSIFSFKNRFLNRSFIKFKFAYRVLLKGLDNNLDIFVGNTSSVCCSSFQRYYLKIIFSYFLAKIRL